MTTRRKLVLPGLTAAALAVVPSLPAVHWSLIGWWRGEAFYDGRPTSYYAARARGVIFAVQLSPFGGWTSEYTYRPGPVERLALRAGLQRFVGPPERSLPTDPAAVPMLVESLDRSRAEPRVRLQAVNALGQVRPAPSEALPALRRAAADEACWADPTHAYFVRDTHWQLENGAGSRSRERLGAVKVRRPVGDNCGRVRTRFGNHPCDRPSVHPCAGCPVLPHPGPIPGPAVAPADAAKPSGRYQVSVGGNPGYVVGLDTATEATWGRTSGGGFTWRHLESPVPADR
jgi:hypothetical protein